MDIEKNLMEIEVILAVIANMGHKHKGDLVSIKHRVNSIREELQAQPIPESAEDYFKRIEHFAKVVHHEAEKKNHMSETSTKSYMSAIFEEVKQLRIELQAQADNAKYKGWSNYETERCWYWLNHWERWKKELEIMWKSMSSVGKTSTDYAGGIKIIVQRSNLSGISMYSDLLQHSIDRINFQEIAEKLIKEAKEQDGGK